MKKNYLLIITILLGAGLFAQNINFNLTGAGARAAGMGGAFIGVADDATAVVWNPAGLTQIEKPEASFVMRFVGNSWKTTNGTNKNELTENHFLLNFLSMSYPLQAGNKPVVGSIAVQNQLDMNYEDDNEKDKGGGSTLTLGISSQIVPLISLGATANIWYGKWTQTTTNPNRTESEAKFSGFNIGTGLMFDLNNLENPLPLKFGITHKTPFQLTMDWKNARKVIVHMPAMLGFGTSFRIGDSFTLAADYEMRAYKNKKITYNDGSADEVLSYYNLNQIRLGAEYLIVTDLAVIPLRIGFFNDPTIQNLVNADGSIGDQIIGQGFSVGTGLIFGNFSFDTSLSYSGYKIDWDNGSTLEVGKAILGLSGIFYF